MPNPAEYNAKLEAYTVGKDPLAMQSDAPRILAALIEGVPEHALRQRPISDKWSAGEIIAHLAEDELASSWRYRQMIGNSGCTLSAFDQDEWARLGDYASWQPSDSLQLFRLLREPNLRMLSQLTADEWNRHGFHAERGKISVKDFARHMAGHDMDQIRSILVKG
jgi:DinB superfamily